MDDLEDTLWDEPLRCYQVRATSVDGAVMTFGLQARAIDDARHLAHLRLPFDPHAMLVTDLTAADS